MVTVCPTWNLWEEIKKDLKLAQDDAIQVAFAALVKKGILSKVEAEQILSRQSRPSRPAVPAIKPPNC
jgi:hypothetical protein